MQKSILFNCENVFSNNSWTWEFIFAEKDLFEISENKNPSKITHYTVLHKTTNATTQNYRPYYTKLHYTTDKLPTHATDTNQVSCTQIRHSDVAMYNLHTKLT